MIKSLALTLLTILSIAIPIKSKQSRRIFVNDYSCGTGKLIPINHPGMNLGIPGTTDAIKGQYPWIVSLRYVPIGGTEVCVGTIVNSNWVLTAASCFQNRLAHGDKWIITAGRFKSSNDSEAKNYTVRSIRQHPQFSSITRKRDIALVQVNEEIDVQGSYFMDDICLDVGKHRDYAGGVARVAGWEVQSGDTDPSKLLAPVLHHADVSIKDASACRDYLKGNFDDAMQMCVYPFDTASSCVAELGAPLMIKRYVTTMLRYHKLAYFQIGIASNFGDSGCLGQHPNVFTRISYYSDWIKGQTRR